MKLDRRVAAAQAGYWVAGPDPDCWQHGSPDVWSQRRALRERRDQLATEIAAWERDAWPPGPPALDRSPRLNDAGGPVGPGPWARLWAGLRALAAGR